MNEDKRPTEDMLNELWASGAVINDATEVRLRSGFGVCCVDLATFDAFREFLREKEGEPPEVPARFRSYARRLLLEEMRNCSERLWCANWYGGIEFILWGAAIHDAGDMVNTDDRKQFHRLFQDAGGCWVWGDDQPEETFVSLEEMERRWKAHTGGKP